MLHASPYDLISQSGCEILLPLCHEYKTDMLRMLGAKLALILYGREHDRSIAACDLTGIQPFSSGYTEDGRITFACGAKNLLGLCERILLPARTLHRLAGKAFCSVSTLKRTIPARRK